MNRFKNALEKFTLEPAQLVLFVYIMLLFSRFVVSGLSDGANEYLALTVLQIMTFAIPAAIWYRLRGIKRFSLSAYRPELLRRRRPSYRDRLRLSAPKPSHIVIILASVLALISGCLLFSLGLSGHSSLEGSFSLYDIFVSKYNGRPLGALWLILAYAALPAVCEELVFRGFLCAEYDRYGVIVSVVMNSIWFGFLHFNFSKLLLYIFAGLVLTALLYATRSVTACVIAHFLYNVFGLFGQQYITEFYITTGSVGVSVIVLITLLLLASVIFCGSARRLYLSYAKNDAPSDYREPLTRSALLKNFRECIVSPWTAACVVLYLAVALILIFI